jgi:pimeloyl-ACP methyl ester carboxylesterase
MYATPAGLTLPGITHHRVEINATTLHYVAGGTSGTPILLVHGFPETWWAFRKLIPLLAEHHRVFAVDLRGFGDSDNAPGEYDSTTSAEDLHLLIEHLNIGPVHLTGQDISGASVFRLAANHPQSVFSLTAIEMGLPGFGLETLADITHGGTWYIGVLTAPGIPEMSVRYPSTASATTPPWRPPPNWRRPSSTSPNASTQPDRSTPWRPAASPPTSPAAASTSGRHANFAARRSAASAHPSHNLRPGTPGGQESQSLTTYDSIHNF